MARKHLFSHFRLCTLIYGVKIKSKEIQSMKTIKIGGMVFLCMTLFMGPAIAAAPENERTKEEQLNAIYQERESLLKGYEDDKQELETYFQGRWAEVQKINNEGVYKQAKRDLFKDVNKRKKELTAKFKKGMLQLNKEEARLLGKKKSDITRYLEGLDRDEEKKEFKERLKAQDKSTKKKSVSERIKGQSKEETIKQLKEYNRGSP